MSIPKIDVVGNENNRVITIDNYANDPKPLIDYAIANGQFDQDSKSFYPGLRTQLPKNYVINSLNPIVSQLYPIFNIPENLQPRVVDSRYSLISTPESQLQALQTLPHFDTPSPHTIAVLHYLNDQPHGGTGLYRHKSTGYEYIDESRQQDYFLSVEEYVKGFDPQCARYCPKKSDDYECYWELEFKLNRLVVYSGRLLHTALINPFTDIDSDPRTGRLTANMLLEFV